MESLRACSWVKRQRGLTLLELLMVLAIVVIIAGFSVPIGLSFLRNEGLISSANDLVMVMRIAQQYSIEGVEDTTYGVYMSGTSYTLFKGTSYAARDTSFDESFDVSGLYFSTTTEVVFQRVTGEPNAPVTVELTDGNRVREVDVNAIGRVNASPAGVLGGS